MANEISAVIPDAPTNAKFVLQDATSQFWNGSSFESYNAANIATYGNTLTQQGSSGWYIGSMPAVAAGTYFVQFFKTATSSLQVSDTTTSGGLRGTGQYEWDGSALVPLSSRVKPADTLAAVTTVANVTTVNGLANDVITSNSLAASAVTEIQSGLATASAVSDISGRIPAALTGDGNMKADALKANGENIPTNFDVLSIDASGRVDIIKIAGTTQTANDLGAINVTNMNTLSSHDPGATLASTTNITAGTITNTQQLNGATTVVLTDASLTTAKLGTFVLAKTTNITGFNDLSSAQVTSACDASIAAVGLTSTVTGRIDVATSTRMAAGSVTVGGYGSGQDPATLVLDALAADYDTPNTIGAAINNSGGGGSSVTVSVIVPPAVASAGLAVNQITIVRGDTMLRTIVLGAITDWEEVWFTVKGAVSEPDDNALFQISQTDGLITLNGQPADDSTQGSLTVVDASTGEILVTLAAEAVATLPLNPDNKPGYLWDAQWRDENGVVSTPRGGQFTIAGDVTRET